ncbi:hypothetical protein ABIE67_008538 [Streptomyces sp. V4I8]|uniref:hypothetical protein n=1 Tax=Streptomyces sp. V4I8 TaxID=3156469 RepID=UPI003512DA4A
MGGRDDAAHRPPGTPAPLPFPEPLPRPSRIRQARWYKQLCFWVLTAIVAGILTGWLWPSAGTAMEPVGTPTLATFTRRATPDST